MFKQNCKAIKLEESISIRGKPTIEWYDNGKPQYYCMGYKDSSIEQPLKTCKNCIDFVGGSQIEIDFKKFQERNINNHTNETNN